MSIHELWLAWLRRNMSSRHLMIFALLLVPSAFSQPPHTVFLVRHAERASSAPDSLLSEIGHKRAECLAYVLKDTDIKQIYATEVKRTQETALPVSQKLNASMTVIPADSMDTL